MDYARECLAEATRKNADTYSSKLFNEAKTCYDSAMANWKRENEDLFSSGIMKEFWNLQDLLRKKQSRQLKVQSIIPRPQDRAEQKVDTLNKLVSEINKLFNAYPLESETRDRISRGKMLLEEAEIHYSKRQYLQANRVIN